MNRRAFTLLETVMAASIGLIIVLTAVGISAAISRADTTLAKRSKQVTELETIHNIMSRAFTTLSMSDVPPPNQRVGNKLSVSGASSSASTSPSSSSSSPRDEDAPVPSGSSTGRMDSKAALALAASKGSTTAAALSALTGGNSAASTSGADGAADASTPSSTAGTNAPPPDPRFVLSPDQRDGVNAMVLKLTGDRGVSQALPQRLEVVLAKPPVPYPPGADFLNRVDREQQETRTTPITTKSFRGAFELLPDTSLEEQRRQADPSQPTPAAYSLWWRPLPPPTGAAPTAPGALATSQLENANIPQPVHIADGITYCRWQAYHDSTQKDQYQAAWAQDLPAYITMEIQTTNGLYANWMFEVDWVVQAEVEQATPTNAKVPFLNSLPIIGGLTNKSGSPGSVVRPNRPAPNRPPPNRGGATPEPPLRARPSTGGRR